MIGVLSHLASGNSYQIISTCAAVKGELRPFAAKLIKYNELSRQLNQIEGVSLQSKAQIFDLTFVILCSLVQDYGSDVRTKKIS